MNTPTDTSPGPRARLYRATQVTPPAPILEAGTYIIELDGYCKVVTLDRTKTPVGLAELIAGRIEA
jgi:hypothetical protein